MPAPEGIQSPNLLFLHSYHKAPWTDTLTEGYEAGLSAFPNRHVAVEYMDTKRLNTPEYLQRLADLYDLKYREDRFDLVITSDDNALDFALAHQDGFLNGAPVVFCGVNDLARHSLAGHRATGVLEHGDFLETLAMTFRFFPDTKRIWILTDSTPTGNKNRVAMEAVMDDHFPQISRQMIRDISLAELASTVSDIKKGDVLFFISFWQDSQGKVVLPVDLEPIFKSSPVPVIGRSEWMIGLGLLGGKCVSGYHQGLAASRIGARILNGTPSEQIPVQTESPNVFMFDYRELVKHGVKLDALPPESLIFNQPVSFFRDHRLLVISIFVVMGLLSILVIALGLSVAMRKKVEQQLLASEARYQQSQKMEAVGQLAAGVAHDFNNLLTPIVGYTEMLLEDREANDPERPGLEAIHEAAGEARNLTRELLSFARKQKLEFRVIDLGETLSRLQDLARRMIRENIDLTVDIDSGLFPVKADPGHILQAGLNLVNNAVDAMPKGGILTISAHNTSLSGPLIRGNTTIPANDYVVLSVADDGQGISTDIQDRIFEPFFTTKAKGKGTGLGLAAVYGIVTQHGGHVWFSSEEGEGTCFHVYLPRSKKKPPEKEKELLVDLPRQSENESRTILLAEDDPMVRELAKQALMRHGFRIIEASDGKDALEKAMACAGKFDLLLSDVVMPGMDGVELDPMRKGYFKHKKA